ncbi:MAG TPA: flavin reductase family protein [Candidatus Omnitrophota bacterium]|nr:flavin reductase family protein [Candidatus Omnitrophota bacterium]HPS19705.1 flavin reductase family protein [Candidatus Omnitrophota bacterium]
MGKKKLENSAFIYPMTMVLIGAEVDGKPNFMAAAWATRVNYQPAMVGVALGSHYTNKGIEDHKMFSVNIPGIDIMAKVDHCGIKSGAKADKSKIFKTYDGELAHAPMIEDCPVSMQCKLVKTVPLGVDTLYIGEIAGVYSEDRFLVNGQPDVEKVRPFMLTMPDNKYWTLGKQIGSAWKSGLEIK